jgi:coenzyme Q-binding protein COQ10
MPQIESTILVKAPRHIVMAIAQDNEKFPQYMDDVESIEVVSRSEDGKVLNSEWVAIVPKFNRKITWIEEDTWDRDNGTLVFRQISGDYDEFHGHWRFTEIEPGLTKFDSHLTYRLEIPLVGILINSIILKAMQNNVDSTLQAIKKRCEEPVL